MGKEERPLPKRCSLPENQQSEYGLQYLQQIVVRDLPDGRQVESLAWRITVTHEIMNPRQQGVFMFWSENRNANRGLGWIDSSRWPIVEGPELGFSVRLSRLVPM